MPVVTARRECDDPRFGAVTIEPVGDGWHVEVAGGSLSLVSASGRLSGIDGDGTAWSGREAFLRRTFDGHAEVGGRRYRLRHRGNHRAVLVRDGDVVAALRSDREATPERGCGFVVHWPPGTPDGTDARIAYLLAAVWGVGAHGVFRRTVPELLAGGP